ncbi:MAG: hypothetical protein IMZ62_06105 [Chloroflexi bacterium]|nr:hypothetical protein [Chloroflexota bacterium]
MKTPSKMSFRRPRTVVEPPKEIEVFLAAPSPVFLRATDLAPGAPYSILFPRDGVVADITVRAQGLTGGDTASITIVPEGSTVTGTRLVVGNESGSIDFTFAVKKGALVFVELDKPVPVLHLSFFYYPGASPEQLEKAKEKNAGS